MTNLQDNYAKTWTLTFKAKEDYELFCDNEVLIKRFNRVSDPIVN